MVPRLREAYIQRDSWTKLNVAPAKIMQVGFGLVVLECTSITISLPNM